MNHMKDWPFLEVTPVSPFHLVRTPILSIPPIPFTISPIKALDQDDYIPFYIEIAKREGLGPEFRDTLMREIENLAETED